jgi:hypothetical protein
MSSTRERLSTFNNVSRGWKELKQISSNYSGIDDYVRIKKIEKLQIKECSLRCSTVFLKRCIKEEIIPKGLKIKNTISNTPQIDAIFKRFNLKIMKELIHLNYHKAEKIREEMKTIRNSLNPDHNTFHELSQKLISDSRNRCEQELKTKQLNKFNRQKLEKDMLEQRKFLQVKETMNTTPTQSTVAILAPVKSNLSSRTLTPEEPEVLEFGLNFAIPNKKKESDLVETALSIECIIHHSKENDLMKDTIRMEIAKEIQKAKKSKKITFLLLMFLS